MRECAVPDGTASRLYQMSALGGSLLYGTLSEAVKQGLGFKQAEDKSLKGFQKYVINEKNAEEISNCLCKMRGAALKLGQLLCSLEDSTLHPIIKRALERTRSFSEKMPNSQVEDCLKVNLGGNWKNKFKHFDIQPIAAASIGQVHQAILKDGRKVAIKIQYPNIENSIDIDLQNFVRVSGALKIFPRSLFLEDMVGTIRKDMKDECNYLIEAQKLKDYKKMVEVELPLSLIHI